MNSFETHENESENPKILAALKALLISHLKEHGLKQNFMPWEFDISDPHEADMKNIATGDFEIANLNIAPGVKGGRSFHFYVGRTEFHLAGRAAERIESSLRQAA